MVIRTRTNWRTPTTCAASSRTGTSPGGRSSYFGLTGGLIPCPAAITVLLLCLQLKEIPLGFVMVLCFSIGLAITLVVVGAAAALSIRHATRRWTWFSTFARRAPYFPGTLIILVGVYVRYLGLAGLGVQPAAAASTASLTDN